MVEKVIAVTVPYCTSNNQFAVLAMDHFEPLYAICFLQLFLFAEVGLFMFLK